MSTVWTVIALLWIAGAMWLLGEWRLAAREDAFDRHCEDAVDLAVADIDVEYRTLCDGFAS